jgi:hypothetical protein
LLYVNNARDRGTRDTLALPTCGRSRAIASRDHGSRFDKSAAGQPQHAGRLQQALRALREKRRDGLIRAWLPERGASAERNNPHAARRARLAADLLGVYFADGIGGADSLHAFPLG